MPVSCRFRGFKAPLSRIVSGAILSEPHLPLIVIRGPFSFRKSLDKCLFKSYRVFRGAECRANTDHYLVAAEVALFPCRNSVKPSHVRRYDIQRLTSDRPLQQTYSVAVQNRFSSLVSLPRGMLDLGSFCHSLFSQGSHPVPTR